jgi:predicted MFS family arabinose efflux permease
MSSTNVGHLRRATPHRQREDRPVWVSAVAGLCASLVGLGLARFAYTPLIPALISAKWFSPADAVYLGAVNLAGYLAGALVARELGARLGSVHTLRAMMVLASLTCFACSVPVSFIWFFGWRFLAGVTGGVIMVLAASTILPHIAPGKRGFVGGVIFAGVGLGVAASGTLVPLLLQQGLKQSWYGLGLLSAVLTLVSWKAWPAEAHATEGAPDAHLPSRGRSLTIVRVLSAEYGLNALALVPHMVFLVDFVARGLGQGISAGSHYWVLYGIGATVGPLLTGHLADRAGFGPALRVAFLVEAIAILLPALSSAPAAMIVSSIIVGGLGFRSATVSVSLFCNPVDVAELGHDDHHHRQRIQISPVKTPVAINPPRRSPAAQDEARQCVWNFGVLRNTAGQRNASTRLVTQRRY